METDNVTAEIKPIKEKELKSLDTTVSSASRPKRKLKPRNYDDYYTFGNHGNSLTASTYIPDQDLKIHNFVTSTPVQKPKKACLGGSRKKPVESSLSDNIINCNKDYAISLLTAQEQDTPQIETQASEFIGGSNHNFMDETSEIQDGLSDKNNDAPSKSAQRGRLSTSKYNANNSCENLIVIENSSKQEDISLQTKKQFRNNIPSALEKHETLEYMREPTVSPISKICGRNRKKNDCVSLTKKHDGVMNDGHSEEICSDHIEVNHFQKSVTKATKRKKMDSSCEDSILKENVVNCTEKIEFGHNHTKSKNMLEENGAESIDQLENVKAIGAEKAPPVESNTVEDRTNCNIDLNATFVPQKKRRGRPPKIICSSVSQKDQTESLSETGATPISEKRPRELPPETVSQEIYTERPETSTTYISEEQTGSPPKTNVTPISQKRPRGRPPKTVSQKIQPERPFETNVVPISEVQLGSPSDSSITLVSGKRKRGRPPKVNITNVSHETRIESNESSPRPLPKNLCHPSNDSSKVPELPLCQLCEKQTTSLVNLKLHMMKDHSLIWSKEYPQGCDNAFLVVKKIGHINCQKCKKAFRNAQYYRHHQLWCGREGEMATCTICQNVMKAMWLQQHLGVHKTQEKKLALENEKMEKKKNEVTVEQEADDDNDPSASKRSRREAAKNAIKLMSSLHDTAEQEDDSSNSGYTSEDSDDDDSEEDDEDDDEEEDSMGVKSKGKRKKSKGGKRNRNRDFSSFDDVNNKKKRIQLVHDFYASWSEGHEFPAFIPRKDDWEPLTASEMERYMPVNEESVKFTFDSTNTRKEEYSLKFGKTMSYNGKTYLYTGGPVWAVEWCPLPEGADHEQIVAVSADRTTDEPPNTGTMTDGPGLIQLWSAGALENNINCCAEPVLRYAIAHDSGYVRSMSWCSKPCFDTNASKDGFFKRLGLLAVGCSDGGILIYCPPQPEELEHSDQSDRTRNVFRPKPTMVLVPNSKKGHGPCLSVSWQQGGNFKHVLAGYGHGAVFLWDLSTVSPLLKVDSSTLRPLRYFSFHNMAVLSLCWNPCNPSVFVTVSFDFNICVWNMDQPNQPIGFMKKIHSHQITRSVCWAGPLINGFFSACDKITGYERTPIYFHGLSKADSSSGCMSVVVQGHTACTWDVSYCPFYELLVTCDVIGKVKVTLPPMNAVRSNGASRRTWSRMKIRSTNIYHARLDTRPSPLSLQTQSLTATESQCESTSSIIEKANQPGEDGGQVNDINRTIPIKHPSHFHERDNILLTNTPFCRDENSDAKKVHNCDSGILVHGHISAGSCQMESDSVETSQIEKCSAVTSKMDNISAVTSKMDNISAVTSKMDNISAVTSKMDNISAVTSKMDNISAVTSKMDNISAVTSKMDNISAETSKMDNISAVTSKMDNISAVTSKMDNISAVTSKMDNISAVTSKMENISAVTSKIDNISAVNSKMDNISAVTSKMDNISAVTSKMDNISAVTSKMDNISAVTSKMDNISAETSKMDNISAVTSKMDNISAVTSKMDNISAVTSKMDNISAVTSKMENISAVTSKIDNISAVNSKMDNISAETSEMDNISAETSEMDNLSAVTNKMDNISAENSEMDNLSVVTSKMDNLSAATSKRDNFSKETSKVDNILVIDNIEELEEGYKTELNVSIEGCTQEIDLTKDCGSSPTSTTKTEASVHTECVEKLVISSRDSGLEFASKSSIASSENNLLQSSKALMNDSEKIHSTNFQANTLGTQSSRDELLHFQDSAMTRGEFKPAWLGSDQTHELEIFGGSNLHAVHRVRLNPNSACCLWLASGGQSGILRLDNLSSILKLPFLSHMKSS